MAGTKIGTPKKTESSAVSKKYEKNGMVQTPRDISARCALGSGATPVSAWVRELNGPVKSNDSRWAKHQAERMTTELWSKPVSVFIFIGRPFTGTQAPA